MFLACLPVLLTALFAAEAAPPTRAFMDETVTITEPTNDLFAMAREIGFESSVLDNAFVMAQEVNVVRATVEGDLFSMSETLRVDVPLGGDLYAMAADVRVSATGAIGGELHAMAGEVVLEGPVGSHADIAAGRVVLAGPVGGDVWLQVGELTVRDGASIAGDLHYTSPEPVPGIDSIVAGNVTFEQAVEEADAPPAPAPGVLSVVMFGLLWKGWAWASGLTVGFALLGLGGARMSDLGRTIRDQPGPAAGLGFLATAILPIAAITAICLVIPIPLGLIALLAFVVGLYIAKLIAAQALGDWILARLRPDATGSPYVSMAVGLAVLLAAFSLPWLGTLAWYAATITGFGAVALAFRQSISE
ncbi:MAG: cytoskeletal protein CcmA (bactofilin family) [Myxococcota bacterium]|jgi:cytoskeletal protein CcmA (bactofilin family)